MLSASDEPVVAERQEPRDANVVGLDEPAFLPNLRGDRGPRTPSSCRTRPAADEQDPQRRLSLLRVVPRVVRRRVLDALDDGPGETVDGRDAVTVKRNGERLGRFFHLVADLITDVLSSLTSVED